MRGRGLDHARRTAVDRRDVRRGLGRIDFLHNNVGIGTGDATPLKLTEDGLRADHRREPEGLPAVLPGRGPGDARAGRGVDREHLVDRGGGGLGTLTAYKISKAGINALGQSLAMENARHGVRVNTIMPGLLDTPMAIDAGAARLQTPREEIRAQRDAASRSKARWARLGRRLGERLPALRRGAVHHGGVLPVDGGQLGRIG